MTRVSQIKKTTEQVTKRPERKAKVKNGEYAKLEPGRHFLVGFLPSSDGIDKFPVKMTTIKKYILITGPFGALFCLVACMLVSLSLIKSMVHNVNTNATNRSGVLAVQTLPSPSPSVTGELCLYWCLKRQEVRILVRGLKRVA